MNRVCSMLKQSFHRSWTKAKSQDERAMRDQAKSSGSELMLIRIWIGLGCVALLPFSVSADEQLLEELRRQVVPQQWVYSRPLIAPEQRGANVSHAQKDPSIVYYEGRFHVFMTVKLQGRSVIEYCNFEDWNDAQQSQRTLLPVSTQDYFCAPQVFYFEPHQLWYLVYQVGNPGSSKMWVAFSTTSDLADPMSWTQAKPMLDGGPDDPRKKGGLDYWIICDEETAYLFYTTNDGHMWRLQTPLEDFPFGFGRLGLALKGDIFEASHTYRLKGMDKYLTIIEADKTRYFQAYIADRLDGEWRPLTSSIKQPFASVANARPADGVEMWTDQISHGELIRDGFDQRLIVDPAQMQFVFQGMLAKEKAGKGYGEWNWRIGLLTPANDGSQTAE